MKEKARFLKEQNMKLWNDGAYTVLTDLYAPDFVRQEPFDGTIDGRQAMGEHVAKLRTQYPDLKITVTETLFDGQSYVARWRYEGTDRGEFKERPVPATGKKVDFQGVSIYHLEDDRFISEQVYYDLLLVMQQLGLIPAMEF